MKVKVLHPTIIDSQWFKVDDVTEVENETAQPYVEMGLIEIIDKGEVNPPNDDNSGDENPPDDNQNPPNDDNSGDENPPDDEKSNKGGKGSKSGKGK